MSEEEMQREKAQLRSLFTSRLRAADPGDIVRWNRAVVAKLRELPEFGGATAVGMFSAIGREPDLSSLFGGVRTLLPRYNAKAGSYEMVEIGDPVRDLLPGRYGILEPRPELDAAPAEWVRRELLFVVPAVACSPDGVRLGRGGGFYDRLLEGTKIPAVAVIFPCQLAEHLPSLAHDRPVGTVIAGDRVIRCGGAEVVNTGRVRG